MCAPTYPTPASAELSTEEVQRERKNEGSGFSFCFVGSLSWTLPLRDPLKRSSCPHSGLEICQE